MNKVMSLALSIVLAVGLCPLPAFAQEPSPSGPEGAAAGLTPAETTAPLTVEAQNDGDEWVDATLYSYEVEPLLAPFNTFLYVKTDNPDPKTFKVIDESIADYPNCRNAYEVYPKALPDVLYENEATLRVKGGYIFWSDNPLSDGGELIVQAQWATWRGWDVSFANDDRMPVTCPELKDRLSYLVDTYTSPSRPFFDNLDAVQAALEEIALYPRSVVDTSKRKESRPWPCWATSPYKELGLNAHTDVFESCDDDLLLRMIYPFALDSQGFPTMMRNVASKLGGSMSFGSVDDDHSKVTITRDGVTRTYGGQGRGGTGKFSIGQAKKDFTFGGSSSDLAKGDLAALASRWSELTSDSSREISELIPSGILTISTDGWIRVACEGSSAKVYTCRGCSDVWVDGRYINEHEYFQQGATFQEHPNASVYLDGVIYKYKPAADTWYSSSNGIELTRAQVEATQPDRNTNIIPEDILIYDGTEYPGTPFKNTLVTGVSLPQTIEVSVGRSVTLKADLLPADATDKALSWKSSDESIVSAGGLMNLDGSACLEGSVKGIACGEADVTVTTHDGAYQATCRVHVNPADDIADATVEPIPDQEWTGSEIKPYPKVTYRGEELKVGTDYTVTFENNVEVGQGTAKVVIQAKAPFVGSKEASFNIVGKNIEGLTAFGVYDRTYTGSPIDPVGGVSLNYKTLTPGEDYEYTISDNLNAGTATVTFTGKGHYGGTAVRTFQIKPAPVTVKPIAAFKGYGEPDPIFQAEITGLLGSDTEDAISYVITREAGEESYKYYSFTISGEELQGNYSVTFKQGGSLYIWGPVSEDPSAGDDPSAGNDPSAGDDPSAGNDPSAGGNTENGEDSPDVEYPWMNGGLSNATMTLSSSKFVYDGKSKEPQVTVKLGGHTLEEDEDYDVSYYDNVNAGTATVAVYGMGAYAGTSAEATYTIAKASQKISAKNASASAKAKKSGKVKKLAKNTTVNLKKKAKVSAKTTVKYAKANKAGGKKIAVNAKTGKVTLKKGLAAGTYKVKVKLTAAASKNYKAAKAKTITLTVKVK